jgi:hypothetical protein
MNTDHRPERERETVLKMITLYCHDHHSPAGERCEACQSLADYALERIARCPFGAAKPTCDQCTVHCYRPEMRDEIRKVMRYAGPRMIFHHPRLAILHLIDRYRSTEK